MKKFVNKITWLQWFLIGAFVLVVVGAAGLAFGVVSGSRARQENLARALTADIQAQYDLGIKDFEDGNYALAQQRFDHVLQQDPNFPGVVDMLAESRLRLSESIVQITDSPIPESTLPAPRTTPTEGLGLRHLLPARFPSGYSGRPVAVFGGQPFPHESLPGILG